MKRAVHLAAGVNGAKRREAMGGKRGSSCWLKVLLKTDGIDAQI